MTKLLDYVYLGAFRGQKEHSDVLFSINQGKRSKFSLNTTKIIFGNAVSTNLLFQPFKLLKTKIENFLKPKNKSLHSWLIQCLADYIKFSNLIWGNKGKILQTDLMI